MVRRPISITLWKFAFISGFIFLLRLKPKHEPLCSPCPLWLKSENPSSSFASLRLKKPPISESLQPERLTYERVFQGLREQRMAQEGAETALLREVSELGIMDDDGAWVGLAGLWIDNRL